MNFRRLADPRIWDQRWHLVVFRRPAAPGRFAHFLRQSPGYRRPLVAA
jgi:hypothetical protein